MKSFKLCSIIAALSIASCNDGPPARSPQPETVKAPQAPKLGKPGAAPNDDRPIALDRLISFSNPGLCELDEAGRRLMEGLHRLNGEQPIGLGKVVAPAEYLPAFGKPSLRELRSPEMEADEEPAIEVRVPVDASWHGLSIIRIESQLTNFSDAWVRSFVFDQPFEKVRSTLNAVGFAFSEDGKQARGPSESAPFVQLDRHGKETSLDCWF